MFNIDALLEDLGSSEGIKKIIVRIILVEAIDAIFIIYSMKNTINYKKNWRNKISKTKIDKLSPKK